MSTTIAITGGIACGKSFLVDRLSEFLNSSSFSCDEAVSNLLTEPEIVGKLVDCVGDSILEGEGKINRPFLRDTIFESPDARKLVEDVLHPAVLEKAEVFLKQSQGDFLLIEVPLLYEVEFPIPRDFDLVIGCSEATQLARLTDGRGIERSLAKRILSAQLPIQDKINRSHFVIWNDGSMEALSDQIQSLTTIFTANSILA